MKTKKLSVFFLIGLFLLMLFSPETVATGAANGLLLWYRQVLPVLFPFLLITGLMIRTESISLINHTLSPILKPFLGISENASFSVVCGFLCGFPVGAKSCSDLTDKGEISSAEGEYLLSFCNNVSPAFLTGYVAVQSLKQPEMAQICLLFPILAALCCSFLFRRWYLPRNPFAVVGEQADPRQFLPFSEALDESILSACDSITKIGGYMIVFSVLISFMVKLSFQNFTIRINDRRILKAMAAYSGFAPESYDTVFIILDKMDKIGIEGVAEELEKEGFAKESIDTYLGLFREITNDVEGVRYIKEKLSDVLEAGIAEDLETIINTVESVKTADFKMSFDPTLVRGMSYYTGPIFEISMDEFGGSVGGGGRYDEMIGKFTGNNTCACGFSIGFERIVMLLLERGYEIPTKNGKKAYLIEKNMPADKLLNILKQATEERSAGTQINISIMKKNKKFQKDQLAADGYTEYVEFFNRD